MMMHILKIGYEEEKTMMIFFEVEEKSINYIASHTKEDCKALVEQVLKVEEFILDLKHYLYTKFSLRSGVNLHEFVP